MRKKSLSIILLLAMMCSIFPTTAFAISDMGSISNNVAEGTIYFGNKADGTTPALYRVVAKDHDTITLFYDGSHIVPIVAFESLMQYHSESDHKKWSGSTICARLNGNEFLSNTSVFTPAEKAAIAAQYSTTGEMLNGVTITPNQSIVLPSFAEVSDSGIWGMNPTTRSSGNGWWLRSPGANAWSAEFVDLDGTMYHTFPVMAVSGVRPAFKLKLSSILFASAAAGKADTAGANLSEVASQTGPQKLTILDSTHTLATATTSNTMSAGKTITVNYGGASTGKRLSAIVADKNTDAVTYYGKLVENVASESGTASVKLPDTFDSNSMKLELFTETINGPNLTDYASEPVAVTVVVPANGTVSMKGTDFKVNSSDATTISYGGKDWRVIGANGEAGVATENGSMTLLAKDNFDFSKFDSTDPYTNNYGTISSSGKSASDLKAAIESSVTFTSAETAEITPVTLVGGTNATAKDGMYGDEVKDAKLWPLSVSEAKAVDINLCKNSAPWWLRSPSFSINIAANVDGNGVVGLGGFSVYSYLGVRPAVKLNLSSVLFASVAAGGKSSQPTGTDAFSENAVSTLKLRFQNDAVLSSSHASIFASDAIVTYTAPADSVLVTEMTAGGKTYVARKNIDAAASGAKLDLRTITGLPLGTVSGKVWIEKMEDVANNKGLIYATQPKTVNYAIVDKYLLTVTSGTGSGSYAKNASVTITADAPQTGKRFKEWIGADGLTFTGGTSKASATATFTMPESPIAVSATYENIPTSSGGSSSSGGGSSSMGRSIDSITGIQAGGTLYSNFSVNRLTNSKTGASNEVVDEKTYNELKVLVDGGFTILGAYEVKCASYSGSLNLSFPVDAKYNGQEFMVKHKTSEGKIHTYTGTVKDGKVAITVPSLSPFMIAVKSSQEKPKDEVWVNPFTDVKEHDWFYEKVALVCKLGLMRGTSTTSFAPNVPVTRGMIVTVLYNMEGKPEVQVNGTQWYAKSSAWAMTKGISDGTNMEREITREQLVTQLWRNASSPAVTNDSGILTFTDAGTISDYAKQAFAWAIKQGIIQGKGNNILDPQGNATRAEAATMIIQYLNAMKK